MADVDRASLAAWLAEQRGSDAPIEELRRIATGNSRANWFVAMADGDRYVLRVEQGGVFGTSSSDEHQMMSAAHALGCPVARVRWFEPSGTVLGQPMFVMDYLDGASAGRDDRTLTPSLAVEFVTRLHGLHGADWASQLAAPGGDPTHTEIERWHAVYRAETVVPIPLLEEAAAWLHLHASPVAQPGIVHGDPGPGNFVHDGAHVIAFTDWEFTHIGDPMEDWVYLVTMRGARTMSREAWLDLFASVAGIEVTDRDLRYWGVFNYFKGACANLTCRRVARTVNPAPNMALIGTALHHTYVRQAARLIEGDEP